MPRLEIFYDVISPYSYLAWHSLKRYAPRWGVAVQPRPFFLGGVMMGAKNAPPGMNPAKGAWLATDLPRQAAMAGLPLLPTPANFLSEVARQSITLQRVIVAAGPRADDATAPGDPALAGALTEAFASALHADPQFRDGTNLLPIDTDFVCRACAAHAPLGPLLEGGDAAVHALLEEAASVEVKGALKATTEEALARGCFGAPVMFLHGEGVALPQAAAAASEGGAMVFGSDRFEQLAWMLGQKWDGPAPR